MERKFIKRYNRFANESKKENDDLIIPKGTELFHGTVEDFDINDIKPGGYDGIFWTSKYSAISQSYIPESGSTSYTKTSFFHRPAFHENDRALQRQLGVFYDYNEIKFDDMRRPSSWRTPDVWREESDKAYTWNDNYHKLNSEIKKKREEYTKINDDFIENHENIVGDDRKKFKEKQVAFYKELNDMEEEYETQSKDYHEKSSSKRFEYETINKALRELGYEPQEHHSKDNDYSWKLKVGYNDDKTHEIYPANYTAKGRLLILTPKEDLKIYDYAKGSEGDLTDLDYHKIDLFKRVEKDGYDGIRINDFAQIESEGNFGHDSIGLFESTIPKMNIVSIEAAHPQNFGEAHMRTGDYESKEYKEYNNH